MKRKNDPGAKLARLDDPGHGITRERFSALVLSENRALTKIELSLGITSPNDDFRRSLIQSGLWWFYLNSIPEADVRFDRAALKKELGKAAELANKLETSAARIWKSSDPAIIDHLQPFGTMFQHWQSSHASGVAWIGLIQDFGLTMRLLADTLTDDHGGPRLANAFSNLMMFLAEHHKALSKIRDPLPDFSLLAATVKDLLRKIEPQLPAAKFKLPPNDDALRRRLSRLGLAPRRPRRT